MTYSTVNRSWRTVRVAPLAAAGIVGAGVVLGTGVLRIPCWFHALTGLDCPFCGGSRAAGALLHGDVAAAVNFNAFAVLVLLPLAVVLLAAGTRWEMGRAKSWWPAGARGRALVITLAGFTLAWWVLRDLPIPGLAWLRA